MLTNEVTGNGDRDVVVEPSRNGGWDVYDEKGGLHCNERTRKAAVDEGERISARAGVGMHVRRQLNG